MRRREFEFPTPLATRSTPKYGRRASSINSLTVLALGAVALVVGLATKITGLGVVGVLLMLASGICLLSVLRRPSD